MSEEVKYCPKCNQTLPLLSFTRRRGSGRVVNSYCKPCTAEYKRLWLDNRMESDPNYSRRTHFRKRYNLTLEEYNNMLSEQDRKCLLCQAQLHDPKTTHVDHCAKTGKVRGILCQRCNMGIGLFDHNIDILTKAIEYLQKESNYV